MIAAHMVKPNDTNAQIFHPSRAVNARTFRGQTVIDSHASYEAYQNELHCVAYTQFTRNHSYVRTIPSRNAIAGFQPRSRSFVTSKSFRGVPSVFVVS